MDIITAERIGSEWLREEHAQAELNASVGAARAALYRVVMGLWLAAEACGGDMTKHQTSPMLERDLSTYYRLVTKLGAAGVADPFQTVLDDALSLASADDMTEEARGLTIKLLGSTSASLKRAHGTIEAKERTVTRIAETLISERAALGGYTVADEHKDYRHARELVYGAAEQPIPSNPVTDDELDAMLAVLV